MTLRSLGSVDFDSNSPRTASFFHSRLLLTLNVCFGATKEIVPLAHNKIARLVNSTGVLLNTTVDSLAQ